MVDLKIENVIAAIELQTNIDLKKIAESVESAEYDPDKFPGLIYKLRSPKTITLIFSRGHCRCPGGAAVDLCRTGPPIRAHCIRTFVSGHRSR